MATGLGHSASDYLQILKALLPKGPAWELEDKCFFNKMLEIAASEFARVDADILKLIDESDPRTASVTLADWFYQWGIPDDCLKQYSQATLEEYRNVLVTKIATQGYTFGELVSLIGSSMGYSAVSIENFNTFTVRSRVNQRLYGPDWKNYFMTITVDRTNVRYFRANTRVDNPLAIWGDQLFECEIKSLAPAQSGVIFQYGN